MISGLVVSEREQKWAEMVTETEHPSKSKAIQWNKNKTKIFQDKKRKCGDKTMIKAEKQTEEQLPVDRRPNRCIQNWAKLKNRPRSKWTKVKQSNKDKIRNESKLEEREIKENDIFTSDY